MKICRQINTKRNPERISRIQDLVLVAGLVFIGDGLVKLFGLKRLLGVCYFFTAWGFVFGGMAFFSISPVGQPDAGLLITVASFFLIGLYFLISAHHQAAYGPPESSF